MFLKSATCFDSFPNALATATSAFLRHFSNTWESTPYSFQFRDFTFSTFLTRSIAFGFVGRAITSPPRYSDSISIACHFTAERGEYREAPPGVGDSFANAQDARLTLERCPGDAGDMRRLSSVHGTRAPARTGRNTVGDSGR